MTHRPDYFDTPAARNRLQQRMITLSSRLDRQVQQLIRLNKFSNQLLAHLEGPSVAQTFAEALVDILDVAVGAVWVLGQNNGSETSDFAVFGLQGDSDEWAALGEPLAAELGGQRNASVLRLSESWRHRFCGVPLVNPVAGRCIGRDGKTVAVVLAANTVAIDEMYDTLNDETLEMLQVLVEKCAAHIDNVSDRQVIERQLELLRESEERMDLVLRGTNDGWWDWNLTQNTCFLSARWLQMVCGESGEGRTQTGFWADRVHERDRSGFLKALDEAIQTSNHDLETEVCLRRDDGSTIPVLVRGTVVRDRSGQSTRFAGSILDLTERKQYESHVYQLAFYDHLTALPNRRLITERIEQALLLAERSGQAVAVMMIDIDRFKQLNDTHGHAAGDQFLKAVAIRLRNALRPQDTVGRLGGDEFVVLMENLGSDYDLAVNVAEDFASRVLSALNDPYTIEVGLVHHSGSVGIAVTATGDLDVDSILKGADVALYEAKKSGRNRFCVFQAEMQRRVDQRSALEADLRRGFKLSQFRLHYQAQVDQYQSLCGAEALIRWYTEDQQPVMPSDFIPIAEESGFIHSLGAWCLETACVQLKMWGDRLPPGFRVSVNISNTEFIHPDFAQRVVDTLAALEVSGSRLRLEITDAVAVTEMRFVADRMNYLRSFGIEFSLDDFGSGYWSLAHLRQLPISEVKIDHTYVRGVLHNTHDAAIVRAILGMCKSLNLTVVAEGVETFEQMKQLLDDGCVCFQGFYFARPKAASSDPIELLNLQVRAADMP